jgi:fibro-slime domain-containing protein
LSPNRALGLAVALAACGLTLGASGCAKVGPESFTGTGGAGGMGLDAGAGGTAAAGAGGDAGTVPDAAVEAPVYATCGNSLKESGETCDDGNTTSGDGCSSTCRLEANFSCPMVGKPCVHDVVCGDHMIESPETCDDGNTTSGDGCSATCTLECGWECPPGAVCRALKCGDGLVAGNEQCDDGNTTDGDGCSAICQLESKPTGVAEGWICTSPAAAAGDGGAGTCTGPTTCKTTTCGNKVKEGSEQCDDGNTVTGDGCDPFCRLEPICPAAGGPCTTACGDGLLLPIDKANGQECDDGNTVSGDGCSSTCKIEPGFTCADVVTKPTQVILPVVYHDFQSWQDPSGHPDFQHYQGNGVAGMVLPALGPPTTGGGVPVHVAMCWAWSSNLCTPPANATPTWNPATDWFGMWYVDTPMYNKTVVQTLTLGGQVNGVASATCNMAGQPACTSFQYSNEMFFPLDGVAGTWGNTPDANPPHDFGFTSVARYWFQYEGVATLSFVGDDDVFVFINKKLAVDLGGTHQRSPGSITLDASNGTGYACDFAAPGTAIAGLTACNSATQTGGGHVVSLGLTVGSVYEIDVFQAERFEVESHYQLTLSNFTGTKSSCKSACGDGHVTPPETCDLGTAMNTGAYGGCNADCTLAPYCGDGVVTPPEQCDPKAMNSGNCDPNCKFRVVQ